MMNSILPAYNDPLFSIILILLIALTISVTTHAWGIYKNQKEVSRLHKFLDKFDSHECSLDTSNMLFDANMLKPLTLLAKSFDNMGEYDKSINIYNYLIKNSSQNITQIELMQRLGKTYLHAGFLVRSESIYIEILRKNPRNIEALYELGIVYEYMQNYVKAKETLKPLSLLGEETMTLDSYITFLSIINSKTTNNTQKVELLSTVLQKPSILYREVISSLFQLDKKIAWSFIDKNDIKEILDILWHLPNSQLDLDIIASSNQLSTLYYIKGYINQPMAKSGIFSLDMIATRKQYGFDDAELIFSYLCNRCKNSFPVSFKRCPNCMSINSIKVEEQIEKRTVKTDQSLL